MNQTVYQLTVNYIKHFSVVPIGLSIGIGSADWLNMIKSML